MKMRILFIHNRYKLAGGEDEAMQAEADLLYSNGHDIQIIIFENSELEKSNLHAAMNAIYSVSAKRKIQREISVFKPHIIHVHNFFFVASPSIFFAAKAAGVGLVVTLHNYRLLCSNALFLRNNQVCELCINKKVPLSGIKHKCYHSSSLETALVTAITGVHKIIGTWKAKVDTYIALTDFSKQKFLASSLDIKPSQLKVLPNFVPDRGVGQNKRESFFLFVGRICFEKGLAPLLECFSQASSQKLVIIGDGPEKESLMKKYGHSENITFKGRMSKDEVIYHMKRCQALIFPSIWYEGLPLTIIEALSTGTPVIVSNLGAMASIIHNEYNGLHFQAGNAEDLKRCLGQFLNFNAREKLYANARQTYEQYYTPEVHYTALIEVYKKSMKRETIG